MCEIESKIKISWQLVSQFVSWDFCRYNCEQNEAEPSEADVLTFLRNMIVERTEKAASDVTKQEIVAKFIMETKTIKTISRMPCIIALAETVKKLCPELAEPTKKLVNHMESFLNVLDWNEDSERAELLEIRMANAVNEFSKAACIMLPIPDLLQVVQTWLQLDSQTLKRKEKYPENLELCNQVLKCLKEEIKTFEVETIARALYDDEAFKRIMYNSALECVLNGMDCGHAETYNQTGIDSQSFSIQSSQPPVEVACPNSLQLSGQLQSADFLPQPQHQEADNSLSLDDPFLPEDQFEPPFFSSQQSRESNNFANQYKVAENIDKLGPITPAEAFLFLNPNPTPLLSNSKPKQSIPPHSDVLPPVSSTDPIIINLLSHEKNALSAEESDCDFMTQRPAKLKCHKRKLNRIAEVSSCEEYDDQDTSDCDKDPEFRFLTPTLFKKNSNHDPSKVVYLSDQESFNSSIVTTIVDSQQNDPNFKARSTVFPKANSPVKKKRKKKKSFKKKNTLTNIQSNQKSPRQMTIQQFTTSSRPILPSAVNDSREDFQQNNNKRKKFKLFNIHTYGGHLNASNTPTVDMQKSKPSKHIMQSLGNKRRCAECKITFKTPSELKKHIFIFHTTDDFSD